MAEYPAPIDALLTLGPFEAEDDLRDYLALGLGPEHIPDLIRLGRGMGLGDPGDDLTAWGPVHAWWALGQIGGEAAVEPLIDLMTYMDERDGDWIEDLPRILGRIGAGAIPGLTRLLDDEAKLEWVRVGASSSLATIARDHPDARHAAIDAMTHRLAMNDPRTPLLNAFIVSDLVDLKAVESAPTIERAFEADCVDLSIGGGWEDTRYRLGLGPMPKNFGYIRPPSPDWILGVGDRKSRPDPKKLLKRKAQKDARRQQQARSKKRKRR